MILSSHLLRPDHPLYEEHCYLAEDPKQLAEVGYVRSYSKREERVLRSLTEAVAEPQAMLADMSSLITLLITGSSVQSALEKFFDTKLGKGSARCLRVQPEEGALLTQSPSADDQSQSFCIITQTEEQACIILGDALLVEKLGKLSQSYPDLSFEDLHPILLPVLLAGTKAPEVLNDYLQQAVEGFSEQSIHQVYLDKIPALVAVLSQSAQVPIYLLFLTPDSIRTLWRSFLSFKEVTPIGRLLADKVIMSSLHNSDKV